MKRWIAAALCIVMLCTVFSGCAETLSGKAAESTKSAVKPPEVDPSGVAPSTATANVPDLSDANSSFTSMADPKLLPYLEQNVQNGLQEMVCSAEYRVVGVKAAYVSKEYLDELAYNSKENVFFGYTLSELNERFGGAKYVFTLGEDGQTAVEELITFEDDPRLGQILKNVAIGAGAILICAAIDFYETGGGDWHRFLICLGFSAKDVGEDMLTREIIVGIVERFINGYQEGGVEEALLSAGLYASEEFKNKAVDNLKWDSLCALLPEDAEDYLEQMLS